MAWKSSTTRLAALTCLTGLMTGTGCKWSGWDQMNGQTSPTGPSTPTIASTNLPLPSQLLKEPRPLSTMPNAVASTALPQPSEQLKESQSAAVPVFDASQAQTAYKLAPMDVLYVYAPGAAESEPINGLYPVDNQGMITLGSSYGGFISVTDKTLHEVEQAIGEQLQRAMKDATVAVTLAQPRGPQPAQPPVAPSPPVAVEASTVDPVEQIAIPPLPMLPPIPEAPINTAIQAPQTNDTIPLTAPSPTVGTPVNNQ